MKKFLSLFLALLLTLSLCACGGGAGSASEQYAKLETAQWQKLINALTANTATGTSNIAGSGTIDITAGDSLLPLLGSMVPENVDLSRCEKNTEWFAASAVEASEELGKHMVQCTLEWLREALV